MLPDAKPGITCDSFLKSILKSGLLEPSELDTTVETIPESDRNDPRTLANHLVEKGKLSAFQAQKFLKGATGGLLQRRFRLVVAAGRHQRRAQGMRAMQMFRRIRWQTP